VPSPTPTCAAAWRRARRRRRPACSGAWPNWAKFEIIETFAPEHAGYEGRTIGDVAAERGDGATPSTSCATSSWPTSCAPGCAPSPSDETQADWELRAEVWRDPRTVVGGSDAGAHLDMMCGAIYSTALLSHGVREFGVVSLEEAIAHLTDEPARLYGLVDRGRIADGYAADACCSTRTPSATSDERMRTDLPGGSWRLFAEATGIDRVLVNGTPVVRDGAFSGEVPGTLLRSGRDTRTVSP
jgi:hypothetical protein